MKNQILVFIYIIFLLTSCEKKETTLFSKIDPEDSGVLFNNKITETDSFNILTSEYIFNGGGVAIGDFNNDNKPDIFFTGNQVNNKLYLNRGGFKFEDISNIAGVEAGDRWITGVAVIDLNNDDLLDIYVCAAMYDTDDKKANMLFVNQGLNKNGIPTFKELAKTYGIADTGNSMNATFLDYDKDGLLDLYVLNNVDIHVLPSNYRKKIVDGSSLSNDKLYHNNGDNTFSDVTNQAGITIEGYGLGLAISDLNYDGWPDIYVSNDYLSNDVLYINKQDGTFSNQIKHFTKHQSKFSMGNDIADYNNDGYLDIITLDMLAETNQRLKTTIANNKYTSYVLNEKFGYEYQYSRNMLQQGNGNGIPFSEIGLMAGVAKTDWSWSPLFADVDNDGYKDLLITNGFPRDITDLDFGEFKFNSSRYLGLNKILELIPSVKIANYAYQNNQKSQFTDVGKKWGLDTPSFSNGAAFADLDNDGDLDYIVNNINDIAFVYENQLEQISPQTSNYLNIKLEGLQYNSSGVGAKIVVRQEAGKFQYHDFYLNRGYMSSVQDVLHFGLGDKNKVASVEVLWPDGKFQKLSNLKSKQTIAIEYKHAEFPKTAELKFPLAPKKKAPLFAEVSKEVGIEFIHEEKDIVDFNVQRILPHKLSQNGPCLTTGDLNNDGFEDFIVGSASGFSPQIFMQNKNGVFTQKELFTRPENKKHEEEDIILFDIENDGDLDLYLVSGGNEFTQEESLYNDRLFINDGLGNFSEDLDRIPTIKASGSVVSAYDYDNDGFTDLFIGGRTPFSKYPTPETSFLLKNNKGVLEDVTDKIAPELRNIGMVTDAIWTDIDSDGVKDLIVVGELMPITFFKNTKTGFQKLTDTGVDTIFGWWEKIKAEDFDKDGDIDFIVGNMGANNFYQPSAEKPVSLIFKDFDTNGTIDPVLFAYFKNNYADPSYKLFPVNFWGDLYSQSPLFRTKYNSYTAYSKATLATFFSEEELIGSTKLIGNYDKSIYLENLGDGKFKTKELPWQAQIAPINGIQILDYNNDGNKDVLLVGNDFGNEVFIGRSDAFNGSLLKGNGDGTLEAIASAESGFLVPGDAKEILRVKNANNKGDYIIVSQNRGPLKVFLKN